MVQRFAIYFLLIITVAILGFNAGRYEAFPYPLFADTIEEIEAFVEGAEEEDLSILQKLSNDINIKPGRFVVRDDRLDDVQQLRPLEIDSLNDRRQQPLIRASTSKTHGGYYLISGVFDFNDSLHGAVLMSPDGEVIHTWKFTYDAYKDVSIEDYLHEQQDSSIEANSDRIRKSTNKFPHGVRLNPDGSLIVATDYGLAARKLGWCGNIQWSLPGDYHHRFGIDDKLTNVWFLRDWQPDEFMLVNIDASSGNIKRTIFMKDIVNANQDIDIFAIRQNDPREEWMTDPWHPNDVEPLPASYAAAFEKFNAGDLLISLRSLNLLFVVDPQSLKVKWWRIGLTRRQHDPDWQRDGTITVFDNNMNREYSRIIKIDPNNNTSKIIYSGKDNNFYSREKGGHEVLPNGNILLTGSYQGRILEVAPGSEVEFEFKNIYDIKSNESLMLTDSQWIPEDFINFKEMPQCTN
jgi:hypothetical protein